MATRPRFYIQPKKSGQYEIFLKYSYAPRVKRLEYFTGWTIDSPAQWSKAAQRARTTSRAAHSDARDINRDLDLLSSAAIDFVRLAKQQKATINPDTMKATLSAAIGKVTKHTYLISPLDYIDRFISDREKDDRYAAGSVTVYRNCRNNTTAYLKAKAIHPTWATFDTSFFASFTEWLYGKKLRDNYVNKVTSTLVTILRQAQKDKVSPELTVADDLVTAPKTIPDKIYLTELELEKIRHAELPAHLIPTRDLFLIGCYTGLRYSDYSVLTKENILIDISSGTARHYIEKITQKTGEKVRIPLRAAAIEIVQQYHYSLPKGKTNQKFNANLKAIALAAGLTENVMFVVSHRGKKTSATEKKYELVTTHTARRTFATNAYLAGIPIEYIMSVTGHATEKEFKKYLKIKATEHALLLAQHQFFA